MLTSNLEHLNVTVDDPKGTAETLSRLFDWKIRWEGDSIHGGYSVHVGNGDTYLALYTIGSKPGDVREPYVTRGGLNHIGIVVDDLDEVEDRVKQLGYEPHSHADYEPGRRFYFFDDNQVEIEVVSYGNSDPETD